MNTVRTRDSHPCGRRAWPRARRLALGAGLLFATCSVLGQAGGSFAISRHSVDSGGGRSSGGGFSGIGAIGQPDAARLQGGAFQLQGGLYRRAGAAVPGDTLFGNGFE